MSNNDGCVISRSNEVKALGVPMGAPLFKVKDVLEKNQAAIFSSNFGLYGDISARVMSLVESLAPRVEIYSIDEVFIDFKGINNLSEIAPHIRKQVLKCAGIPTCIGVAPTKTLAKVANHVAKSNPQLSGVYILDDQNEIDAVLKTLGLKDLWGIGSRMAASLNQFGIRTAYDLKHTDTRWMRQHFTVIGERIIHELNGISCLSLEPEPKPRQSIQVSKSFSESIGDLEELKQVVATYATRLAQKMRHHNLKTSNILVSLQTNRFRSHQSQHYNRFLVELPLAVNDDANLIKACLRGLSAIYKEGLPYHKDRKSVV